MSRLADRIIARGGTDPFRALDLEREWVGSARDQIALQLAMQGVEPGDEHFDALVEQNWRNLPVATETISADEVGGVPVFAVDDVARYVAELPEDTDYATVMRGAMAPPFPTFFSEARVTGDPLIHAWGVLFTADGPEVMHERHHVPDDEIRWVLTGRLIVEWDKGRPVGPVIITHLPLGMDGCPIPMAATADDLAREITRRGGHERTNWYSGEMPSFDPPQDDVMWQDEMMGRFGALMNAHWFALMLMHCANTETREIAPPPALSKKHRKKNGHDLVRYRVLDIRPMRRVLDEEGDAQSKGLGHALHICRGHFKTFTEDKPLFGKVSGQFWWPAHVRGAQDHGVVEKDYRVFSPESVGAPYRAQDPTAPEASAPPDPDEPDRAGRGWSAHATTQNALAEWLTQRGLDPRSPAPDEPDYDLLTDDGEVLWVFEVKSLTPENEERQLRTATGQVLRYRQKLGVMSRPVRAVIIAEHEPADPEWEALLDEQDIALAWPGAFGRLPLEKALPAPG